MALTNKLTAIADAIREKTGGTDLLTLDGMVEAVNGLSTGGGDIDAIIDRSVAEVGSNVTSIGSYAFYYCKALTTADFPLVTSIGESAFSHCEALTTADFPLVTSIGESAFDYCYKLTTISFPLVTSISNYAFRYCSRLTTINLPIVTSISTSVFIGCETLTTADFPLVTSINNYAFRYCFKLTSLVLRDETVCTLNNKNAFDGCYHFHGTVHSIHNPNGDKDGYIYVPRALIEDYKVATNWTTYATQFRALEDYTIDGTITGELDESKI